MEQRYKKLRRQLDDFGYNLPLVPDAVPLVEKLSADLIQTTESLRKYMQIAKDAIEERDNLQLGAEPYKCDNAKLVKECNDLHLTFLQFREQHDKLQKDLKRKVSILEREKGNLFTEVQKQRSRMQEIELEKNARSCQCSKGGRMPSRSTSGIVKNQPKPSAKPKNNSDMTSTMALAEEKVKNLSKELLKLKDEQLVLTETNETLANQLANRDKEISRLNEMLSGGRPSLALTQDCCFREVDMQVNKMQDEMNNLRRSNSEFDERLRDAVSKQHEAMKRALHLAERNKQLEKEMCDIDQMALAVEAECNTTVKCNTDKVNRMQNQMHETSLQIRSLEREAAELKREKQELMSDLDAVKLEKKHLQGVLETALEEKKRMTDKINRFTVIEQDLNMEIDRLMQISGNQKRKMAELECRLLSGRFDCGVFEAAPNPELTTEAPKKTKKGEKTRKNEKKSKRSPSPKKGGKRSPSPKTAGKKKSAKAKAPADISDTEDSTGVPKNTPVTARSKQICINYISENSEFPDCCNPGYCLRHSNRDTLGASTTRNSARENSCTNVQYCKNSACNCRSCTPLICSRGTTRDGDIAQRQAQISCAMEHMAEKEYYMKEYHRISEQLKNVPNCDLYQKLQEKEQLLRTMQHENKSLAQDKHNLMTRLETARDQTDNDAYGLTLKSSLKRLERENELLKADILKMEEERDAIRHRLQMATESQITDRARLDANLREAEEQIRKLEQERRELMQTHGSRRATLSGLEEQCAQLSQQLCQCQTDLNQQRALYSQLKSLHEQTDKSLADSHGLVSQLERELMSSQDRSKELERGSQALECQCAALKNDIFHMKGSMGKIDSEKDSLLLSLDDKTERIAHLEQEHKSKENAIRNLESSVDDLRRKISSSQDNTNSREHMFRTVQVETQNLREELESALRAKDIAVQENRRLQEDLIACATDCKKCNTDLEIARRQIDDLKRQLQTYVAEVKRTEDLISQKEIQRSEMLDQFRSLSQEATTLENSNHTLESEATQSRVQLSVALDHAGDLEAKLDSQDTMIRSYERQIAELTSQIASMEVQLKSQTKIQERSETELKAVRDLCVKLDEQKDKLVKQVNERQSATLQMDRDVSRLRREGEALQSSLALDRNTVDSLEKLLREARQEVVEQTLVNQELQAEIKRLKGHLEELHSKFVSASEQLDLYQEKALDYSQQNKQLRREIANERFHRAHEDDRRSYNSEARNSFASHVNENPANEKQPQNPTLKPKEREARTVYTGKTDYSKSDIPAPKLPSVSASEQLDLYQEKAVDYSEQNKQLRREIANERFHRAHEDDRRSYSTEARISFASQVSGNPPTEKQSQNLTLKPKEREAKTVNTGKPGSSCFDKDYSKSNISARKLPMYISDFTFPRSTQNIDTDTNKKSTHANVSTYDEKKPQDGGIQQEEAPLSNGELRRSVANNDHSKLEIPESRLPMYISDFAFGRSSQNIDSDAINNSEYQGKYSQGNDPPTNRVIAPTEPVVTMFDKSKADRTSYLSLNESADFQDLNVKPPKQTSRGSMKTNANKSDLKVPEKNRSSNNKNDFNDMSISANAESNANDGSCCPCVRKCILNERFPPKGNTFITTGTQQQTIVYTSNVDTPFSSVTAHYSFAKARLNVTEATNTNSSTREFDIHKHS